MIFERIHRTRETSDPKGDIITLAKFIKRVINSFSYIPQAVSVGNSADTLRVCNPRTVGISKNKRMPLRQFSRTG